MKIESNVKRTLLYIHDCLIATKQKILPASAERNRRVMDKPELRGNAVLHRDPLHEHFHIRARLPKSLDTSRLRCSHSVLSYFRPHVL